MNRQTEAVNLLKELIAIPSINPMGMKGKNSDEYYEGRIGRYIEDYIRDNDIEFIKQEVYPKRYNVGGIVRKRKDCPTIIFLSHLDTVDFDREKDNLLNPIEKDGIIYGRGAADAKAGLACMLVALEYAKDNPDKINKNIIVMGVVDEEYQYKGVLRFLEDPLTKSVDMGVVGEPTSCHIVYGLKGAARWEIEVKGRSCHSSEPEKGINAIYRMSKIVKCLERYHNEELAKIVGSDLGRATLSVGVISGGIAVNIVPDNCRIQIDRRLLIGEDPDKVREKVTAYLKAQPEIDFEFISHPLFTSDPAEKIEKDSVIVKIAKRACKELNIKPIVKTVSYGSDQSRMIRGGIPTIMLGPGNINVAHTDHESVHVDELEKALNIYMKMMEV
jgi:acetylornithine deacetylase